VTAVGVTECSRIRLHERFCASVMMKSPGDPWDILSFKDKAVNRLCKRSSVIKIKRRMKKS